VLLLDTHVWVWALEGDARRIGRRARALLSKAASSDAVRVSPLSLFELTALHVLGRLRLAQSPDAWIRQALQTSGVRIAELSTAAALDAGSIPRSVLADPLDRLLVATARQLDATFLTRDERILAYAASNAHLRVHDAAR